MTKEDIGRVVIAYIADSQSFYRARVDSTDSLVEDFGLDILDTLELIIDLEK